MQVFGPNADAVAGAFDEMLGAELATDQQTAIDMTSDAISSKDNFMYFGPGKETEKVKATTPATPSLQQPRRITQPADAPISIE